MTFVKTFPSHLWPGLLCEQSYTVAMGEKSSGERALLIIIIILQKMSQISPREQNYIDWGI